VEAVLHERGSHRATFVVAGVPDARKGERLVVRTGCRSQARSRAAELPQTDLPNLWVRPNRFSVAFRCLAPAARPAPIATALWPPQRKTALGGLR
jgi:hypothetical protein